MVWKFGRLLSKYGHFWYLCFQSSVLVPWRNFGVLFLTAKSPFEWTGIFLYLTLTHYFTRVSSRNLVTIVSKLGYFTYLGDEINLLILGWTNPWGELIQLLSTLDIPVVSQLFAFVALDFPEVSDTNDSSNSLPAALRGLRWGICFVTDPMNQHFRF